MSSASQWRFDGLVVSACSAAIRAISLKSEELPQKSYRNPQQDLIVIPGKPAIAGATRNPGFFECLYLPVFTGMAAKHGASSSPC